MPIGRLRKLATEYAQLPQTVSQAFERLRNAFGPWINRVDESTELTKKLAEALTFLAIKQRWRFAMAQPLLWGKDLERELIDYMEQNHGEFYRRGGMAKSDTVSAMLTPGEFVVNKDAVARYGAGFFEVINNLSAPAQALAGRALAGVQGFATGGLVQPSGSRLTRPVLATDAGPSRTVRVEPFSGERKVRLHRYARRVAPSATAGHGPRPHGLR